MLIIDDLRNENYVQSASDYLQINLFWMQITKRVTNSLEPRQVPWADMYSDPQSLPFDLHTRFRRPKNFIDLHPNFIFSFI